MTLQDTQSSNNLFEYMILFQIIYPIFIFFNNIIFQNHYYLLISLFLKTFYILALLFIFFGIYYKKYLSYKLIFLLTIFIFFFHNVYNLNLSKSIILLIPTLTILVQSIIAFSMKESFIINNKNLIYKFVIVSLLLFITYFIQT